jgi:DNA-binding CsgD family transcriptional regulator
MLEKDRMLAADTLSRGREAIARQAWAEGYAQLSAADREGVLEPEDLECLATAAFLLGMDAESAEAWSRAHTAFLDRGETERSVRCAFWLALGLVQRGERARGGGWLARARRLLDDRRLDCVEQGYLLLPSAFQTVVLGDAERAAFMYGEAAAIGERFGERDLVALAQHGQGRCLIRAGRIDAGVSLLDEAMVAVEAGQLSPRAAGDVYCSVIAGCMEVFDLRRAREWTTQMTRWCESQPGLVAYTGQCLVHRAEVLQLHGAWTEAGEAARHACERCQERADPPTQGAAWYQRGELHRLRGEAVQAEEAYRQASRWGRTAQPGLALLRLGQGEVEAAAIAIKGALNETEETRLRSRLLPAQVEIMVAAGDVAAARTAAAELAEVAKELGAPVLRAAAEKARGTVLLAEGEATAALAALRQAWTAWQEIQAPYEAARVRVLIGAAYRALGDKDAAEMELDAARWIFQELGAAGLELAGADSSPRAPAGAAASLSPRELEVLRLVATGRTNRAIAAELFISERTVERHVSNIFLKLEVSSRAAATAWAYQHHLA